MSNLMRAKRAEIFGHINVNYRLTSMDSTHHPKDLLKTMLCI